MQWCVQKYRVSKLFGDEPEFSIERAAAGLVIEYCFAILIKLFRPFRGETVWLPSLWLLS
eukprot:m.61714 g.61714  ORF g.61714 m.61714 type:complete len:60 (+) comp35020_c0_seq12:696-875(+)